MTNSVKRFSKRSVALSAALGTSTMMLIAALTIPSVQAASHVSRISLSQAANGYTVKATYNMDVVIRFDGNEHIAYVWGSNNLLFNPRFVTGGKLLVLQSTARPVNMAVLPELGRPAGTLTVVLESGDSVVLNLLYTPQAQDQILEIFRSGGNGSDQARLPDILSEVRQAQAQQSINSQMRINSSGSRVTQDGFISPLSGAQPSQSSVGSARQQSAQSGLSRSGYSIVDRALAAPGLFQSGPDASAYKAFIQFLQQGRADGADFEPTLAMAQRMTGVSDSNLVWLVRQLATVEIPSTSAPPTTLPSTSTSAVSPTSTSPNNPQTANNLPSTSALSPTPTANNLPTSTSALTATNLPTPTAITPLTSTNNQPTSTSVIPSTATSTVSTPQQVPPSSTPVSIAPSTIAPVSIAPTPTTPSLVLSLLPALKPILQSATQPLTQPQTQIIPPAPSTTPPLGTQQKVGHYASEQPSMSSASHPAALDSESQVPVTLRIALHPFSQTQLVFPLRLAPRPILKSPSSTSIPGSSVNPSQPVGQFSAAKEAKLP
jgi:hypothetical protein